MSPSTSRPTSITASAVVAILGSIVTALFGAGMIYISVSPTFQAARAKQLDPSQLRGLMIAVTAFIEACAVWGIATAVGLVRLRGWARISIVVFAAILLVGASFAFIVSLTAPLPPQPGVPAHFTTGFRTIMAVIYAIPICIAAWWLFLFNRQATKAIFANADPASASSTRPVSISVIGYLLIIGGVGSLYPVLAGLPGFFAGGVFTGWSARIIYAIIGAAEFFAGTELLELRERGRLVAIGVCCVTLVNGLGVIFSPGAAQRFIALQSARFSEVAPRTVPPHSWVMSGAWVGLVALVPLWYLIRRKSAFRSTDDAVHSG